MEGEKKTFHAIPGQFEFDGMRFGRTKTPQTLTQIRDELTLNHNDVVSTGLPKTGTTRTNEIVFQILADANEEVITATPPHKKFDYIELQIPGRESTFDLFQQKPSPRLVRSHLPMRYFERHLHEGGPKIVVTVRNPKDTIVSTYHFYRMNKLLGQFQGSWDEFFDLYKNDRLTHEDYMKYYAAWMKTIDHPNVHLVKFEDLKSDTAAEIVKLARFLNKELSDEQVQTIVRLTSFEHMGSDKFQKANPGAAAFNENISKFFRKGDVGDWKNYFSEEQNRFVDNQYETILKPLGLNLRFE